MYRTPNAGPRLSCAPLPGLLLACALAAGCGRPGGHGTVDFNEDIRPIFNEQCITCHGGVKRKAGFSLLFRSDALDTTESGRHAIVPGDAGASELIRRVTHPDPEERMPPEGLPLRDEQIALLRRWIEEGAPWKDHWAYAAPRTAPLPDVSAAAWPKNGLDYFVLARLEAEGLAPSPAADCATLLRRVSLDLVGLPPTPAEADTFCSDPSAEAYEAAVDRLLASPHFGERWAAMWLDLARYADSQGYEKDLHRTIWKYRDWVIDAFNRDLPFDQFTIEQLAGDLLPGATTDQLLATAFHRNTMTNDEGGTDDEEFRIAAVLDRLNTTWEVWQGTTIACVQCHSHPYDPFRHEEYYKLFGFFNETKDVDRTDEQPVLYSFPEEHEAEGQAVLAEIEAIEKQMEAAVETPEDNTRYEAWLARLEAYATDPTRPPTFDDRTIPRNIIRIASLPRGERDGWQRAFLKSYYAGVAPELAALREQRAQRAAALNALEPIQTPILKALPEDRRRRTRVFERGNWLVQGDAVQPDVPGSMPSLPADAPRNRLGLARWLVSEDNPLTARVIVNRFWAQLFGTGLVETVEDFGTQGTAPSHPALLDWLALQFMHEDGWRVKALLKQIVTSATYQQASRVTPALRERDPANRLLARGPRVRLTAEQLRDQALAVSGLLDAAMHGPSVMPPQPPGLWQNPYSDRTWETAQGPDRYRRALYTYWRRTVPYPAMVAFDSPSREFCVSRRVPTNTPLQALVTLNDPAYVEAAQALALRMIEEGGPALDDRLTAGYRRVLLQAPRPAVLAELHGLYEDALAHFSDRPDDALELLGPVDPDTAATAYGGTQPHRKAHLAALPSGTVAEAEQAALTVVANALLNLDAAVTKE